jgi:hypothetical protein
MDRCDADEPVKEKRDLTEGPGFVEGDCRIPTSSACSTINKIVYINKM